MYFSYRPGLEILWKALPELCRGRYKAGLFFLGTKFDSEFLADILELVDDLDVVTGQHVLGVAFLPPPKDALKQEYFIRAFGWDLSASQKREYQAAMTRSTYELAGEFNIPTNELPGVLVINPEDLQEVTWVNLNGISLKELFPEIRKVLSDWYETNADIVKMARAFRSIHEASSPEEALKTLRKSDKVLYASVCRELAPLALGRLWSAIQVASRGRPEIAKGLMKQLRRVEEQLLNMYDLQSFLNVHSVTLDMGFRKLEWKDVPYFFAEEVRKAAEIRERETFLLLPECAAQIGNGLKKARVVKKTSKWLGKHIKLQDVIGNLVQTGVETVMKIVTGQGGGKTQS